MEGEIPVRLKAAGAFRRGELPAGVWGEGRESCFPDLRNFSHGLAEKVLGGRRNWPRGDLSTL
jgi:hypothetical protein